MQTFAITYEKPSYLSTEIEAESFEEAEEIFKAQTYYWESEPRIIYVEDENGYTKEELADTRIVRIRITSGNLDAMIDSLNWNGIDANYDEREDDVITVKHFELNNALGFIEAREYEYQILEED